MFKDHLFEKIREKENQINFVSRMNRWRFDTNISNRYLKNLRPRRFIFALAIVGISHEFVFRAPADH